MSLIGLANKVFRENYLREMDNVRTYGGYGEYSGTNNICIGYNAGNEVPSGAYNSGLEERVVNTNDGIRVRCGYCQRYGPSNEYECRGCGAPT